MNKKELILVIEDEEIIASMLKDNLEQLGYSVMIAGSGVEGLRRAEYLKPDIITLDVMMPGLDGMQVLKSLKRNEVTRNIPVVLISVAGNTERYEALNLGAVDFFKKPIDFKRLNEKIKTITKKGTILVVEDDPAIITVVKLKLGSLGYKIIAALDSETAILKAKEVHPDLILMDYMLPKKDGFELIEELKKNDITSNIPMIIFSGYLNEDLEGKTILGVEKFLRKKFSIEELAKEVVDTLRKK